jgi:uncharacterized protein (TIGR00299 family) protein
MRCGYFDCFSGAAGDMILAAMLHAGLSLEVLQEAVARLRLPEVTLTAEQVDRGGLAATHVSVQVGGQVSGLSSGRPEVGPPGVRPRHLPEIQQIIGAAGFSERVTRDARRVFARLGQAEATVHGTPVEEVHFHEVGAADAIVDIVGACVGVEALGLEEIVCSPIPTGSGTVTCAHGQLPVPAPATAELLRGVPLAACSEAGELTTPTGAAILTTLARSFGPLPAMRIATIGYGAGTRQDLVRPNVLRLLIGDVTQAPAEDADEVAVLETEMDDATGQVIAFVIQRLLEAGALDAYAVPIVMKKGRPGQLLTVLGRPGDAAALEDILFAETTTLGVRRHGCLRHKLARSQDVVATRFGPIRVKVGRRGEEVRQAWPEYDDCAAAAREQGVPLKAVQEAALKAWLEQQGAGEQRSDR